MYIAQQLAPQCQWYRFDSRLRLGKGRCKGRGAHLLELKCIRDVEILMRTRHWPWIARPTLSRWYKLTGRFSKKENTTHSVPNRVRVRVRVRVSVRVRVRVRVSVILTKKSFFRERKKYDWSDFPCIGNREKRSGQFVPWILSKAQCKILHDFSPSKACWLKLRHHLPVFEICNKSFCPWWIGYFI